MSFGTHLEEFAGLPVRDFRSQDGKSAQQVEPDQVAWRLRADTSRERRRASNIDWDGDLAALYEAFVQQVDPTRVVAIVTGMPYFADAYEAQYQVAHLLKHAASWPNLRAIFLGDVVVEESDVAYMQLCDPTPLLEAFPQLEELRLRGSFSSWRGPQIPFAPFRHNALRTLVFESGGLSGEAIRAVGRSEIPELEHIEFYFGDPEYGGDGQVRDVDWLLEGDRFPKLRHLGLRDSPLQDEIAAAVAHAPVVARLASLDLSLGTLGDEGASALLAGQPLTHLKKLDLHHHFMSDAMMERLREALPEVDLDVSDQEEPEEWDEDEPPQRYIAVSE